jgi:hypothetical protein
MASTVSTKNHSGRLRALAALVAIAGVLLIVGGAATWFMVRAQLQEENITIPEDARWLAGETVDGPLSAYSQADIINTHALAASGGRTYSELDADDPARQTVMTASFLRASLFTSIVSFGIAVLAAGLGVLFLLIAWAIGTIARSLEPAVETAGGELPESGG